MSRAIIGTIVAVLIFGGMSTEAQTPKSPELKVLDRLVGSWRVEVVARQANGEEKKSTATGVAKWSLQGQYIESRTTDSDGKQVALSLYTYDSDAGVYKIWSFVSNSSRPTVTTLLWHESKETFKGRVDLGNGFTVQTTGRFIGNDRHDWTGTTKDAFGNVLVEMEANYSRKK